MISSDWKETVAHTDALKPKYGREKRLFTSYLLFFD